MHHGVYSNHGMHTDNGSSHVSVPSRPELCMDWELGVVNVARIHGYEAPQHVFYGARVIAYLSKPLGQRAVCRDASHNDTWD